VLGCSSSDGDVYVTGYCCSAFPARGNPLYESGSP